MGRDSGRQRPKTNLDEIISSLLRAEREIREEITDVQLKKKDFFELTSADVEITRAWTELLDYDDPFLNDAQGVIFEALETLKSIEKAPNKPVSNEYVIRQLKELDRAYRNFAEVWGLPEKTCVISLRTSRPVTVALVANDVAHCIHNVANALSERSSPVPVYSNDVYVQGVPREKVLPVVEEERPPKDVVGYYAMVCREWSKAKRLFAYTGEGRIAPSFVERDVKDTACYITPAGASARLGSSPGHSAHVEVIQGGDDKGTKPLRVRVTYYDTDRRVRGVFGDVLRRELGATCKDVEEDGKVVCEFEESDAYTYGSPKNTLGLATAMAMMSSSDVRMKEGGAYAKYFAEQGKRVGPFPENFDRGFFDLLPDDKRVAAEKEFVASAVRSYSDELWRRAGE